MKIASLPRPDGTGAIAAVKFATFPIGLTLANLDFVVT
jgi:hypothetical protein